MLLHGARPVYLSAMGELEPGTVFAGHRIEAVAGRGGMGIVYRATQLALDRIVALKVIAAGLLDDPTARNRFVRESKVAASIDHPNVIPVYYAGEEEGIAYIAMRYVAGDDIRSLVRRERRLAPERAARITAQVGSALDAAHAAGLVHRDVKPANVLLTDEDHAYLTDFGLSKHALSVAGSTKPGHWVGTLDYVAPEQIRGERIDARADVYALGCLLFFTLTGEVPFKRESDEARLWAHLADPPPRPSGLVPEVPAAFDFVVERALAKDPEERYPSAGDLGRAAVAAAAGRRPAERERLVATGAAAPVESPTVTARPEAVTVTKPQLETETVVQERSMIQRGRRPALLVAALIAAAGVGVAGAVVTDLGADDPPPEQASTPAPTPAPTAARRPELRVAREFTVGDRPNVVRVVDGNVFVASFRLDRVTVMSATTGRRRSRSPRIGQGAADAAVGFGSLWFVTARAQQLVKVNPRSGRVRGKPIRLAQEPRSVAVSRDAIWVGLVNDQGADLLLKLDPRTGRTLASGPFPAGITAIATSPTAVWIVSRLAPRLQRVDPDTARPVLDLELGDVRGEDIEYREGAVWVASPSDNAVYKVLTHNGEIISIGVGQRPRQLALGDDGRVYVTAFNSNELFAIDERTSRFAAAPVSVPLNPYALAVGAGAVWVASLPDDKLSKVVTGPVG
jgi:DNA-binding beta-propeller fold protein YncE